MLSRFTTMQKLLLLKFISGSKAVAKTIAGIPPLIFTAVAKTIASLIQYGKTEQNGTPTPTSPVDIKCNNGVLAMVDDDLPSGYKRLQYIHLDGSSYFDSGIVPKTYDYEIETKFSFDVKSGGPNCAWGYMGSSGSVPRWILASYSNGYLCNANTTAPMGVAADNDPHIFKGAVFEESGTPRWASYYDGEQKQAVNLTNIDKWLENTLSIYIGARNNNGTAGNFTTGDLYYHKVTKGDVLIQYIVPCENPLGVLGLYDIVSGTFFENLGSGTPTAGAADYSHAHIGVVGTDEVLMLNGANLADTSESNLDIGYYINNNGARITGVSNFYTLGFIAVKPSTVYTMHTSGSINYFNTMEYDASKGFIKRTLYGSAGNPAGDTTTFTTGATTVFIRFGSNMDGTTVTYDKISAITWMLTEGSTAESYEPYRTQTATAVNLLSVGDYADTQDIISGAVNRKIGIYVFDGTETWINGNYGYITEAVQDQSDETYTALCTHFRGTTGTPQSNSNTFRCYRTSGGVGRIYIAPNRTTYDTKEAFATFIAEQYAAGTPVIVVYPLAEEVTETVTPQPLSTSKGTNVISITAEVSNIELEVTYYE